ncbi:hypothetical protein DASB73_029860 [Starmerella bacillaris]|uniref:nitric oxide dioxygenase n=1 Tax=Starmerella bacillaris TaxID=1247836 RepID=A0AAV5RKN3_STABA|nr:hypothetical protein DASB73_029860 [Starmerella bacillaris]
MIEPLPVKYRKIIAASVPLLEARGEQLTSHFYKRMMCLNPEVKKYFNQTRQRDGSQAKSLARSVLLYAKNIEQLSRLEGFLESIIQKHVALDIQPAHYHIVGSNLLASMEEVFGEEIANPTFMKAWTQGYDQLAEILIGSEHEEYVHLYREPGGWSSFRPFLIKDRVVEGPGIISLYLVPEDRNLVLSGEAGQYITLKVMLEHECRRSYSLSGPLSNKGYRITIKKIGSVSSYLHELEVGQRLKLRPPLGEFVINERALSPNADLIFIAGGIGVTPLAAFAHAGFQAKLLYYAKTEEDRIFMDEFREMTNITLIDVESMPTKKDLRAHVTRFSQVYTVGPVEFMRAVNKILDFMNFPPNQRHFDFFGSTYDL